MTQYALNKTYRATIGADGTARIDFVGPPMRGEVWEIDYTAVYASSIVTTYFEIFTDSACTRKLEGTANGNENNSDTKVTLRTGQQLFYRWRNGTPGSACGLTISGTQTIPGDRGGGI